jgi:signal transduction histidine kinase
MAETPKHARSERERTDSSLGDERRRTDHELARRRAAVEENAEDVVAAARKRADEVLSRDRGRADQKLERAGAVPDQRAVVDDERRRDDGVVRAERARADQGLFAERDARQRALSALLALERAQTDEHLLDERGLTDEMIGSRDDFLAIVSHDLRNMLGGLAMSAAVLLRSEDNAIGRDAIDREARRIQRYTARMTRLVGDLLDVVSIDAGRLAVTPERHDAKELLGETLDVFRPLARVKMISIETDVRGGSLIARYDYERILQVLANLVGNAIKFTAEGGRINLEVEVVGDEVRFAVRDNGVGIDPDKLRVVFDRFWQGREKHHLGLGLGLFISKCVVEAHGGRIWAESQPGAGSAFYFTLPVARASTRDVENA